MHRLFIAVRPPILVRDRLRAVMGGVPGARWQDDDQLHLTLRFIGEVDGAQAADIAAALDLIVAPAVTASVVGVGSFGRVGAIDTLWAGVAPQVPLAALHAKIDRALFAAHIAPDGRAYVPHITLARLARSAGRGQAVGCWLADHAALTSEAFTLNRLVLYESTLGENGARYDPVADWPLSPR